MQEKEELIAIYNKEGKIVNYKKRKDIDKKKEILKQINIIILDLNNNIFVTNPKDSIYKEPYGSSASGLLRKNETINGCAKRTLKRELNLNNELILLNEKYYDFNGIKRIMSVFYFKGNINLKINNNDIYKGKWLDFNKVEKLINSGKAIPTFEAAFEVLKNSIR